MKRTTTRTLQAVGLSIGAPLGWLLIELLRGVPASAALLRSPLLYLYMTIGTAVAFGLYGSILGRREDHLLDVNARLEVLSVTDALTGLRNVRYFYTRLAEELAEAKRTGEPLAVVILDLDHFKRVNDEHGHLAGDAVLINTARAISATTRHGETEARIGGEEFALLLPNSSGASACEVAERVRSAIAEVETRLPDGHAGSIRITASAGVASTSELPGATAQELLQAADDAMYTAKAQGRDRTIVAGPRV